jgi:hypothetical protein
MCENQETLLVANIHDHNLEMLIHLNAYAEELRRTTKQKMAGTTNPQ